MGAELDRLFDIAGARRAGDHVDGARKIALAKLAAKPFPDLLISACDIGGGKDHDVIVREEIERRWIIGSGMKDQASAFGDPGEGMGKRGFIGRNRPAPPALQSGRML